jgi:hypothetical protein
LGHGEFLVCQVVGAALIVLVCGFFLVGAIDSLSSPRQLAQADAGAATHKNRKQPSQSSLPRSEPSRHAATDASADDLVASTPQDNKGLTAALKARGLEIAHRVVAQTAESSRDANNSDSDVALSKPVRTEIFRPASEERIITEKFASAGSNARAFAPEKEPVTLPRPVLSTDEDLRQVRSRLHDLGFLSSAGNGTCDAACKSALRDFKLANRLANDDVLDSHTREQLNSPRAIRADQSFLGNWCRAADKKTLRLSISSGRAKSSAGSVCMFHDMHVEDRGWRVRATCSEKDQSWSANGKITLASGKLVWASERDVVSYSRCK